MSEEKTKLQAGFLIVFVIIGLSLAGTIYLTNPFEINEIIITNAFFSDKNNNNRADRLKLVLKNQYTSKIDIENITLTLNNSNLSWDMNRTFSILPDEKHVVKAFATTESEELKFLDLVVITISYRSKSIHLPIRLSIEFSDYQFIFEENFQKEFNYTKWSHYMFRNASGMPVHGNSISIGSWQSKRDYLEFDKCLKCTTRNCQFILLNATQYNFNNFNFSIDLKKADNDGIGIVFNYKIIGDIPQFYILWQTDDHPIGDEDYYRQESSIFNWSTINDTIALSHVSLYFVKGYTISDDIIGYNWWKLNSTLLNLPNYWRNWRIEVLDSSFIFYYEQNELLTYDNMLYSGGTLGLLSFENKGSIFDNFYVW